MNSGSPIDHTDAIQNVPKIKQKGFISNNNVLSLEWWAARQVIVGKCDKTGQARPDATGSDTLRQGAPALRQGSAPQDNNASICHI